ncbi:hypothetical protein E2320_018500 [Naja naja]|nr:hypothetical protein E2320_018500 [Naja naja]
MENRGALYCLLGNHSGVCLANLHDWDCIVQTWPAIVSSGLSKAMSLEKPSIVRLFDDLAEKIHRQYETIGLDFTVREMAATTLGGLLQCHFLEIDNPMQTHFEQLCKMRLPKRRKRDLSTVVDTIPPADLVKRHAGVLGLSACILSSPYDVPTWMPQLLMDLSAHLNDPQPIEMTVKKTLSNFRRTHHDNWQQHKQQFTDDQLLVLTDLLVSPCYYA